ALAFCFANSQLSEKKIGKRRFSPHSKFPLPLVRIFLAGVIPADFLRFRCGERQEESYPGRAVARLSESGAATPPDSESRATRLVIFVRLLGLSLLQERRGVPDHHVAGQPFAVRAEGQAADPAGVLVDSESKEFLARLRIPQLHRLPRISGGEAFAVR